MMIATETLVELRSKFETCRKLAQGYEIDAKKAAVQAEDYRKQAVELNEFATHLYILLRRFQAIDELPDFEPVPF